MYTVDYFIQKFEAIPGEFWITGSYGLGNKHCAYGHCGLRDDRDEYQTIESNGLSKLFNSNKLDAVDINDGRNTDYQQPTPKQRILAALYDIKKMQQPQYPDIRKELAVFEIGDKTDLPVSVIIAK